MDEKLSFLSFIVNRLKKEQKVEMKNELVIALLEQFTETDYYTKNFKEIADICLTELLKTKTINRPDYSLN